MVSDVDLNNLSTKFTPEARRERETNKGKQSLEKCSETINIMPYLLGILFYVVHHGGTR